MATYKARKYQSHFDLAVQLYGDISQIGEILKIIPDINGEIALGTTFEVPVQTDPRALFFKDRIVATDLVQPVDPDTLSTDDDEILLTDDDEILLTDE